MRRVRTLLPLKRRAAFLAVAAGGKKWVTPGLIMQIKALEPAPVGSGLAPLRRYGLTASKRVGNAVMRNRARRRLRALARELLEAHSQPQYDYVLIARPETVSCEAAALRRDFVTALKRLKAWKEESS